MVSTYTQSIPALSVAGLNVEEHKKYFIKKLMSEVIKDNTIPIVTDVKSDPQNPFDSNAIKVIINGFDIGFIAKNDQYYFDFSNFKYTVQIMSWGVLKDGSVYVYISVQPIRK